MPRQISLYVLRNKTYCVLAYFPNPGGAEGKKRSSGSQVTDAVNSEGRTVIFSFVFSLPDTTGLPA